MKFHWITLVRAFILIFLSKMLLLPDTVTAIRCNETGTSHSFTWIYPNTSFLKLYNKSKNASYSYEFSQDFKEVSRIRLNVTLEITAWQAFQTNITLLFNALPLKGSWRRGCSPTGVEPRICWPVYDVNQSATNCSQCILTINYGRYALAAEHVVGIAIRGLIFCCPEVKIYDGMPDELKNRGSKDPIYVNKLLREKPCRDNYIITGVNETRLHCSGGVWKGQVPNCQPAPTTKASKTLANTLLPEKEKLSSLTHERTAESEPSSLPIATFIQAENDKSSKASSFSATVIPTANTLFPLGATTLQMKQEFTSTEKLDYISKTSSSERTIINVIPKNPVTVISIDTEKAESTKQSLISITTHRTEKELFSTGIATRQNEREITFPRKTDYGFKHVLPATTSHITKEPQQELESGLSVRYSSQQTTTEDSVSNINTSNVNCNKENFHLAIYIGLVALISLLLIIVITSTTIFFRRRMASSQQQPIIADKSKTWEWKPPQETEHEIIYCQVEFANLPAKKPKRLPSVENTIYAAIVNPQNPTVAN